MRKLFLGSLLAIAVSPVSAAEIKASGDGTYRMGEFDTINSAMAMAEQNALDNIASEVQERVLSIKKIDKNGYFSRASWLVNGAVVTKTRTNESVGQCDDGKGLCAKVSISAVLDTAQSELMIKKLYSDIQIANKIERVILEDAEREKHLLEGDTVDFAEAKERQAKRKQILSYLTGLDNEQKVGLIDLAVLEDLSSGYKESQKDDISKGSIPLEYQNILNNIKANVRAEVVDQVAIVHDDGTGGIRLKVKLISPELEDAMQWTADQLGIPKGNWSRYELRKSWGTSKAWFYRVKNNNSMSDDVTEAVMIAEDNNRVIQPDRYLIQYGLDGRTNYHRNHRNTDSRLDYEKIKLVRELMKNRVCMSFSIGQYSSDAKCLAGGESNSKTTMHSSTWDATAPFLWFAKNGSTMNVFIKLDKASLRDPNSIRKMGLKYKATLEQI